MTDEVPVSHWLTLAKQGDATAAQPLWELYYNRLMRLVVHRLPPNSLIDLDGIAGSAFFSFWQGARLGRFPRLDDRQDLWAILITIVAQKISDELKKANALKRGRGYVRTDDAVLLDVIGREPSHEFLTAILDELEHLMAKLDSDEYRRIAVWKLENRTHAEIAGILGCAIRTVTNRLEVIRRTWSENGSSP